MAKGKKLKDIPKVKLMEDAEAFRNGSKKFTLTNMTVEWMDNYVAKLYPDTIDEWIKKCIAIPLVDRKINGTNTKVKDAQTLRKIFVSLYFHEQSEEAKEAEKARVKAEKARLKAEKEAFENLSPEEQFRLRMKELATKE